MVICDLCVYKGSYPIIAYYDLRLNCQNKAAPGSVLRYNHPSRVVAVGIYLDFSMSHITPPPHPTPQTQTRLKEGGREIALLRCSSPCEGHGPLSLKGLKSTIDLRHGKDNGCQSDQGTDQGSSSFLHLRYRPPYRRQKPPHFRYMYFI